MTNEAPKIDDYVQQLADLFALLGDVTRLRIILTCLGSPTSVGEIAQKLGLSSSLVSHHLRLLRAARLYALKEKVSRCSIPRSTITLNA